MMTSVWSRGGRVLAVLWLGTMSLACAAQRAPQQTPRLTTEQWRADVRHFAKELPKRHKNLYHSVTPAQFERAVAALDGAIPSLQPHEIVVRLKQIAALVGDGHTGVHIPQYFQLYPLALYWFGPELRVIAAQRGYERVVGTRVVAIGDVDIDEVEKRVRTCFPSVANENEWYALSTSPAFITRPEVLHALRIVPDVGAAAFTVETDSGERVRGDIMPIAMPPVSNGVAALTGMVPAAQRQPLYRQQPGETFWFTYLAEQQTVYVSFRSYASLRDHARALFRFLDTNPVQRLVIDMRQNGGGDFLVGRRHLIRPLLERPELNRKGGLYVIIGRRTFSAAMANAIDFRKDTNATLVGEPIGERPNSYSENDEMTLPNSRLVVSYSTRYYQFLEQDVPAVLPDVRIDPGWEDFRAGRDAAIGVDPESGGRTRSAAHPPVSRSRLTTGAHQLTINGRAP